MECGKMIKKNGYGIFYFQNGNVYKGEWVNDQKHGKGVYIKNDGNIFKGIWKNNEFEEGIVE